MFKHRLNAAIDFLINNTFNSLIANNIMKRTMRTGHCKHLTRVGEGCASVICHYSCDLEDGGTLDKVTLIDGCADVFAVLTEGQWASLSWSAPRTATRSVTTLRADFAINVWESQQAMVAA